MTITTITIVVKNVAEQTATTDTTPKGKDLALVNVVMATVNREMDKEMVMATVNSSTTNNKVVTTKQVATTKEIITTTNEDPIITVTIVPITSSINNKVCVNLNKVCDNLNKVCDKNPPTKATDVLATGIARTVVVITTRPKSRALNAERRNRRRTNWMRTACHFKTIFELVMAIDTKPNPVQVRRRPSL